MMQWHAVPFHLRPDALGSDGSCFPGENALVMGRRLFPRGQDGLQGPHLDEGSLSHYNDSRGKCFYR